LPDGIKISKYLKKSFFPKNLKVFGNVVNAKNYYNLKYQLLVCTKNAFQFICRTLETAARNSKKTRKQKQNLKRRTMAKM